MSKIDLLEPESSQGGNLVGRDPRKIGRAGLESAGFKPMSPMAAIRARCLDCANTAQEVRFCAAVECPSWPFRMGMNPWRTPMSEERRAAARERIKKTAPRRP